MLLSVSDYKFMELELHIARMRGGLTSQRLEEKKIFTLIS